MGHRASFVLFILILLVGLVFSVSCDEDVPRERDKCGIVEVSMVPAIITPGSELYVPELLDPDYHFWYAVNIYEAVNEEDAHYKYIIKTGIKYGDGDTMTIKAVGVPVGTWSVRVELLDENKEFLGLYSFLTKVTVTENATTKVEVTSGELYTATIINPTYIVHSNRIGIRSYMKENYNAASIPMTNGLYRGWQEITGFDDHAFDGCTLLTSIPSIDCNIQSIGKYSFANCTSLESYVIPEGVERIEEGTFQNCTSLRSVTIPSSVKYIGKNAFQNCTSLEEIVIPEGVPYIDYNCFDGCTSLSSVQLPSTIKLLKPYAFNNCEALQSLELPEGLIEIQEYALYGTGLLELDLPDSVVAIRRCGLANCQNLVKVKYGSSSRLKVVCSAAFMVDVRLTTLGPVDGVVRLPAGMNWLPGLTFNGCMSITDVFIPEGILYIYGSNFMNCRSLVSIHLPDSLTFISSSVFKGCSSLPSIYIPEKVDYMPNLCFEDCSSLMRIDCGAEYWADGWGDYWFGNLPEGATINMGVSR